MRRVLITVSLFCAVLTFASRDAAADTLNLYVCSATMYPPGYQPAYGQDGFMSVRFTTQPSCAGVAYPRILCTTGATHLQCRVGTAPLPFTEAALQTLARWLRDAVLEQNLVTIQSIDPGIGVLSIGISP